MKNLKKNIGREAKIGDNPTTSHTPRETPAPLVDLADLADLQSSI